MLCCAVPLAVQTSCEVIMNHNTQQQLANHGIAKSLLLTFKAALLVSGQFNTWGQLLVRERGKQFFSLFIFSPKSYWAERGVLDCRNKISNSSRSKSATGLSITWWIFDRCAADTDASVPLGSLTRPLPLVTLLSCSKYGGWFFSFFTNRRFITSSLLSLFSLIYLKWEDLELVYTPAALATGETVANKLVSYFKHKDYSFFSSQTLYMWAVKHKKKISKGNEGSAKPFRTRWNILQKMQPKNHVLPRSSQFSLKTIEKLDRICSDFFYPSTERKIPYVWRSRHPRLLLFTCHREARGR